MQLIYWEILFKEEATMTVRQYISACKCINDYQWGDEKWLYYDKRNQNYVLPTIVGCCLMFFVKDGIVGCFLLVGLVKLMCICNNAKHRSHPYIQKEMAYFIQQRINRGEMGWINGKLEFLKVNKEGVEDWWKK